MPHAVFAVQVALSNSCSTASRGKRVVSTSTTQIIGLFAPLIGESQVIVFRHKKTGAVHLRSDISELSH